MGKAFGAEIDLLPHTVQWALSQDVRLLRRVVQSHSGKSLLVVGSGGSSTAAAFLAQLHEAEFRKVSRWTTPLGLVVNDARPENCAIALISAEGKNRDVIAAAQRLLSLEAPGFAVTLAPEGPLARLFRDAGATVSSFDAYWGKDGYLATNSLIATLILLARAYAAIEEDSLREINQQWLESRRSSMAGQGLWRAIEEGRSLCVLHGRYGSIGAIDLESKLAESAMGSCQAVDYRQFAHGRHLQMADATKSPCFLAYSSERDRALAEATTEKFPAGVPVVRLVLPESHAMAEIVAVIDALLITDLIAAQRGIDPGQPNVPEFGRAVHALDLSAFVDVQPPAGLAVKRKLRSVSERSLHEDSFVRAGAAFCKRLERARIRALVCDFDGTFCNTDMRFDGLDVDLIPEIERIAGAGVCIGFATGRGDSLHRDLRSKVAKPLWSNITLGFYSGSHISNLDEDAPSEIVADSRLLALGEWLASMGLIDADGKQGKICGGQMSLRLMDHGARMRVASYARQWIEMHGHRGWRLFYSGHSLDLLSERVGKNLVVDAVARQIGCDANEEVLRLGDSGDVDGNDVELLANGIGLSVAGVSVVKEECWNFLPVGCLGAAGARFYLKSLQLDGNALVFSREFIDHANASISGELRR